MSDLGLLILRVAIGWVVLQHGLLKLGLVGTGGSVSGVGQWFQGMGMRPGLFWALVATAAETVGSVLMIVGLGGPVAPAIVAGNLLVVTIVAHWPQGFWVGGGKVGWEFTVPLFAAALALSLIGNGAWSLDAVLGLTYPAWLTGASLAVAAAGALVVLASRAMFAPKPSA